MPELKHRLKALAVQSGIYAGYRRLRRRLDPRLRKYRQLVTFTVSLNGEEVHFSTQDEYSNAWFYPRYAGGRIHEPQVTELLLQTLKPDSTFLDIGANLGWYACLAGKFTPQGRVYAFEMDESNFALLRANVRLNRFENIEIYQLAVSDVIGTAAYGRPRQQPSPEFSLRPEAETRSSGSQVIVPTTTIDTFIAEKGVTPDVIKIDVEGAEMKVLRGMRASLEHFRPTIFLEIHPGKLSAFETSTDDIVDCFVQAGYRLMEIPDLRRSEELGPLRPIPRGASFTTNTMILAAPILG